MPSLHPFTFLMFFFFLIATLNKVALVNCDAMMVSCQYSFLSAAAGRHVIKIQEIVFLYGALSNEYCYINMQGDVLGFNNGKYQTPPNREAAMWSQKTPSSQQVWTVCVYICLVHGWKASQV